MKKRNIIALLATLAAALILFAACGKNTSDELPEVSTVVGADGQIYEEVTEVQTEVVTEIVTEVVTEVVTDKKGEAQTDKEGRTEIISEVKSEVKTEVKTTVVTVTKPYVPPTTTATTTKADETTTSASTTGGSDSTQEETIPYEDELMPGGTPVENPPKVPLMQQVLGASQESKQFYIDCKVVTGESLIGTEKSMPVKMYLKGNNMAFEFTAGLLKIRMVSSNGKFYMLFPDAGYYYEMSSADTGANPGDVGVDLWGSLGSTEMDYVETTRVTIKTGPLTKETYTCETYKDSSNTNKYYFQGKQLKRIEIIASDGTTSIFHINACSSTVSDSAFVVDTNKLKKLDEEKLQGMLGSLQ